MFQMKLGKMKRDHGSTFGLTVRYEEIGTFLLTHVFLFFLSYETRVINVDPHSLPLESRTHQQPHHVRGTKW